MQSAVRFLSRWSPRFVDSFPLKRGAMQMFTRIICCALLWVPMAQAQNGITKPSLKPDDTPQHTASNLPSEAEIGELLDKASEFIANYQRAFTNAKPILSKAPSDFYDKKSDLPARANEVIASIKTNGSTAYRLVGLISMLDDMSLTASRASLQVAVLGIKDSSESKVNAHWQTDMVAVAQAGQSCYDISELLLHATLRYIAVEEAALRTLLDREKK
jgi:hypothetical protein